MSKSLQPEDITVVRPNGMVHPMSDPVSGLWDDADPTDTIRWDRVVDDND